MGPEAMRGCVGEVVAGCQKIQRHKLQDGAHSHPPLGRRSGAAASTAASRQEGSSPWCHGHTLQELLRRLDGFRLEETFMCRTPGTSSFSSHSPFLCSCFINTFPLIRKPLFCLFMPSSRQPPPFPSLSFQVSWLSCR